MKKLVVIGAKESGKGAAYLGVRNNWSVFVSDMNDILDETKDFFDKHKIEWEEGGHSKDIILNADLVVKSPGVPSEVKIIQEIAVSGIQIISEIEFASRYTKADIVGITGSNGKTTTTTLTYELLKHSGKDVQIAGNVGNSFAFDVAEHSRDMYVVELSSFQLDDIDSFKPFVSVMLNLSPDHLNRYDNSYQKYIDAKFQVVKNQTEEDYFIYCLDDKDLMGNIPNHNIKSRMIPFSQKQKVEEGAYLEGDTIIIQFKKKPSKCPLKN